MSFDSFPFDVSYLVWYIFRTWKSRKNYWIDWLFWPFLSIFFRKRKKL